MKGKDCHVRVPRWGGRAKNQNSSWAHPRKFGLKRFLTVTRSWRGSRVACFWATSFGKIIGGVTEIESNLPERIAPVARLERGLPKGSLFLFRCPKHRTWGV
jgi:hypothetical protein